VTHSTLTLVLRMSATVGDQPPLTLEGGPLPVQLAITQESRVEADADLPGDDLPSVEVGDLHGDQDAVTGTRRQIRDGDADEIGLGLCGRERGQHCYE